MAFFELPHRRRKIKSRGKQIAEDGVRFAESWVEFNCLVRCCLGLRQSVSRRRSAVERQEDIRFAQFPSEASA